MKKNFWFKDSDVSEPNSYKLALGGWLLEQPSHNNETYEYFKVIFRLFYFIFFKSYDISALKGRESDSRAQQVLSILIRKVS